MQYKVILEFLKLLYNKIKSNIIDWIIGLIIIIVFGSIFCLCVALLIIGLGLGTIILLQKLNYDISISSFSIEVFGVFWFISLLLFYMLLEWLNENYKEAKTKIKWNTK